MRFFFFILIFLSFSIFCLFFIPSIYCFNLNDCIPMSPSDDMPTFGRLSLRWSLLSSLIKPTLTDHRSAVAHTVYRYFHFVSTHTAIDCGVYLSTRYIHFLKIKFSLYEFIILQRHFKLFTRNIINNFLNSDLFFALFTNHIAAPVQRCTILYYDQYIKYVQS